jgi:hypothetical protein
LGLILFVAGWWIITLAPSERLRRAGRQQAVVDTGVY